ncbi:hypothetical protein BDZ45DRAFT_810736 [Acephala macrosclerotiorum]|nr:hypothetical protein BDZ45DRAFT_810736 [Acephala macrosclerotiorum]
MRSPSTSKINFSSDPYSNISNANEPYLVEYTTTFLNTKGTYVFICDLTTGNCSAGECEPKIDTHISNLTRTVLPSKKEPSNPISTFSGEYYGLSTCPMLANSPSPPPNPCVVQIDSALASRISASMSATACGWAVGPASIASSVCNHTYPTATAKTSSSVR